MLKRIQSERGFPFHKYGVYRARVEETNDPWNMGRVKVRIPSLHDEEHSAGLGQIKKGGPKVEDCPWAMPAYNYGGPGCGEWHSLCVGDFVYVMFEHGSPYNPIWFGSADPIKDRMYSRHFIHGHTPDPDSDAPSANTDKSDDDYEDYLPKDGRPMSQGSNDRYGNFCGMYSYGFFPVSHKDDPAKPGPDYASTTKKPEVNDPDRKYIVNHTKYGHTFILSDVGYKWDKEFSGELNKDVEFEDKRIKYLTEFFNENKPNKTDQRRVELRSKYGHKFEFRDVGWNKTRPGEYDGKQNDIGGGDDVKDERWLKLRTKAGWIVQSIDRGYDSDKNLSIKKLLKSDVAAESDKENDALPSDDARVFRVVSPYGFKFVMDDRYADKEDPEKQPTPARGVMLKTKRAREAGGKYLGFGLEMQELDETNRFLCYTPKSKIFEMSDKHDYIALCTDTSKDVHGDDYEWNRLGIDDWARWNAVGQDMHANTYFVLLDKKNKYAAIGTPHHAIEIRDDVGNEGDGENMSSIQDSNDPSSVQPTRNGWMELRGKDDSGFFLSGKDKVIAFRNGGETRYVAFDEQNGTIIICNEGSNVRDITISPSNDGTIRIQAKNIELYADDSIKMYAKNKISMKSDSLICSEAAGSNWVVKAGLVGSNVDVHGASCRMFLPEAASGPGAQSPSPQSCAGTDNIEKVSDSGSSGGDSGKIKKPKLKSSKNERFKNKDKGKQGQLPKPSPSNRKMQAGGSPNSLPASGVPGAWTAEDPKHPGGIPCCPEPGPEAPWFPLPTPKPTPTGDEDKSNGLTFEPIPERKYAINDNNGGALWYGVSSVFLDEVKTKGLLEASRANHNVIPPNINPGYITLVADETSALGDSQAELSVSRYGGVKVTLRILNVPDYTKFKQRGSEADYYGDITPEMIDVYQQ